VAAIRTRLWLQCRWENGPAASEPCPQKRMTASWSGPYMGSTEYKRGSRAIARGQRQAPLGSSRGKPPDHVQPAAVFALVKDNAVICGRDGTMHAWRVEQRVKRQSTTKMA